MKHLNNYKIFEREIFNIPKRKKKRIDAICTKYSIANYTINDDGSIDVNGSVNLSNRKLTDLPIKFGRVSCPEHVSQDFYCSNNNLKSLKGGPKYVGGNYSCVNNNRMSSLEGSPKYIGGNFYFRDCNITSLEGFPEYVGGNIVYSAGNIISSNPITSIVKYFISREDKNNLIELFNYYDIVQDMNVIYDRLKFFYEGINIKITKEMLKDIEGYGYKIIY